MPKQCFTVASLFFFTSSVFAFSNPLATAVNTDFYQDHVKEKLSLQTGFFSAHQGRAQHIPISSLIGDDFSVTDSFDTNALIGLGYYRDARAFSRFKLKYGVNVLYLFQTDVKGIVTQESQFQNLSYSYRVTHVPIYGALQAIVDTPKTGYQAYFDLGIGPNIMTTSAFREQALDANTLPDNIFRGTTIVNFSAMAGIGLRATSLFQLPVECGYRFFYLGVGHLDSSNTQVLSDLGVGQSYAHSLVCGLTLG